MHTVQKYHSDRSSYNLGSGFAHGGAIVLWHDTNTAKQLIVIAAKGRRFMSGRINIVVRDDVVGDSSGLVAAMFFVTHSWSLKNADV